MSSVATDLHVDMQAHSQRIQRLRDEVGKVLVGQKQLVDRMILALIADGHVLLEGVPGLAKTTAVKALADSVDVSFSRLQFTPDLLPADVIGTEIYRPGSGEFTIKKGPIFAGLVLADEINRAPAKVQSALLEAMQERQVTIGDQTLALPKPFLVLATQNPIEQEGTYPLPEAQVDRFMFKLRVGYPDKGEEREIMRRMSRQHSPQIHAVATPADILAAREAADMVYVDAKVEDYIIDLVFATREPAKYHMPRLQSLIEYGVSPRATIFLARAAKVHALMSSRTFVTPQDVKSIAPDILRHRLLLTYEAEAQNMSSDDVLAQILGTVDVP